MTLAHPNLFFLSLWCRRVNACLLRFLPFPSFEQELVSIHIFQRQFSVFVTLLQFCGYTFFAFLQWIGRDSEWRLLVSLSMTPNVFRDAVLFCACLSPSPTDSIITLGDHDRCCRHRHRHHSSSSCIDAYQDPQLSPP